MLLFSLVYKYSQKYLTRHQIYISERYSFSQGGNISLHIGDTTSQSFYVGLFHIKQHDTIRKALSSYKNLCNDNLTSDQYFTLSMNGGQADLHFSIPNTNTYFLGISPCDSNISNYTLSVTFRNPNSNLSRDVSPVIIIKGVAGIIYSILLILWLLFRFVLRPILSPYWIILTITLSVMTVSRLISFLVLYFSVKSEFPYGLTFFDNFFDFLSDSLLFFAFAIAPIGLPSTLSSPRIKYILYCVGSTILMAFPIFWTGKRRQIGQELWINVFSSVWIFICFLASFSLISRSFAPLQERSNYYHMKPEPWDLTGTRSNTPLQIENTPARIALVKQYWHIISRILIWSLMYLLLMTWMLIPYSPDNAYWLSNLILESSLAICTILEFLITILTNEEDDFYRADEDPDQPIITSDTEKNKSNEQLATTEENKIENGA